MLRLEEERLRVNKLEPWLQKLLLQVKLNAFPSSVSFFAQLQPYEAKTDVAPNEKLQWLLKEVVIRDNEEIAIILIQWEGRLTHGGPPLVPAGRDTWMGWSE
ncbi:hypothetical protein [Coxiella endosymbiont of Ornithodoros maritimus]|uniref:hypothetical protein n=1 Tax=Coxiella endosymbiont of Ornithodoros maritimus TaxID=1656172 RepID=UPI0022641F37|nr:hypothetical protein [Coxiella endosymbiont of Ornithodoros maritimus]